MCHPGLPRPNSDSQKLFPSFSSQAFHRAKSWILSFSYSSDFILPEAFSFNCSKHLSSNATATGYNIAWFCCGNIILIACSNKLEFNLGIGISLYS